MYTHKHALPSHTQSSSSCLRLNKLPFEACIHSALPHNFKLSHASEWSCFTFLQRLKRQRSLTELRLEGPGLWQEDAVGSESECQCQADWDSVRPPGRGCEVSSTEEQQPPTQRHRTGSWPTGTHLEQLAEALPSELANTSDPRTRSTPGSDLLPFATPWDNLDHCQWYPYHLELEDTCTASGDSDVDSKSQPDKPVKPVPAQLEAEVEGYGSWFECLELEVDGGPSHCDGGRGGSQNSASSLGLPTVDSGMEPSRCRDDIHWHGVQLQVELDSESAAHLEVVSPCVGGADCVTRNQPDSDSSQLLEPQTTSEQAASGSPSHTYGSASARLIVTAIPTLVVQLEPNVSPVGDGPIHSESFVACGSNSCASFDLFGVLETELAAVAEDDASDGVAVLILDQAPAGACQTLFRVSSGD
jgi:hypothetical protein